MWASFFNVLNSVEKAWGLVTFDAGGHPTLVNSFNVSSVGLYHSIPFTAEITLTSGFTNMDYVVIPSTRYSYAGPSAVNYYPLSNSQFWMATINQTPAFAIAFVAFGN